MCIKITHLTVKTYATVKCSKNHCLTDKMLFCTKYKLRFGHSSVSFCEDMKVIRKATNVAGPIEQLLYQSMNIMHFQTIGNLIFKRVLKIFTLNATNCVNLFHDGYVYEKLLFLALIFNTIVSQPYAASAAERPLASDEFCQAQQSNLTPDNWQDVAIEAIKSIGAAAEKELSTADYSAEIADSVRILENIFKYIGERVPKQTSKKTSLLAIEIQSVLNVSKAKVNKVTVSEVCDAALKTFETKGAVL